MIKDENSDGSGTCDGDLLQFRFTSGLGNKGNLGGKAGGDAICNGEFPGYHMCDYDLEIYPSGKEGCLPIASQYFYFDGIFNRNRGFINNSTSNCQGWTIADDSSERGHMIFLYSNASWKISIVTSCTTDIGVACCK